MVDMYDQIVGTNSDSKITVVMDNEYKSRSDGSYAPVIEGTSQFFSTNGTYNVSGVSFKGTPGEEYLLRLQTDSIDMTKPSN